MDKKDKFYITTAIPYVNAPPHIGHALEFVQTDVIARFHRLNEATFLTTGSDENALKNVQAAEKLGVSTQELVNKNAELFKVFAKKINVIYDGFDRGSDKKTHWPGVIDLWKKCEANGDIYKKSYKGLYCVGCESFVKEKDLVDGKCSIHGTEPDVVEEENYFFKLSNYQKQLEKIIETDEYQVIPKTRKNEVLSFIKEGLEDFSISRSVERAKGWGIPVPGDEDQVIYVWFDALSIYLTAIGFGTDEKKFKEWWPADVHVVGKDIIRFHAVYWPAMLLSAGIDLPKQLLVHGFINFEGRKMSKTLGNIVEPLALAERFGTDALRYYLIAEIPTMEDGNFSEERFIERYNSDLANGLGNLTARILTLATKIPIGDKLDKEIKNDSDAIFGAYKNSFEALNLRAAISETWALIAALDKYIERTKPWESKDEDVIYTLLYGLANVASLTKPFLPETSDKIFAGLGISSDDKEWKFAPKRIDVLFPRLND